MKSLLAEAVEIAVQRCNARYPGADVYGAEVKWDSNLEQYRVDLSVEHFSTRPTFYVSL